MLYLLHRSSFRLTRVVLLNFYLAGLAKSLLLSNNTYIALL